MNWDYIAGFFDGEGSVLISEKRCRIAIPQTNFEILNGIKNFVGSGNVVSVAKRKSHWKDAWVYYIAGQRSTLGFLENIVGRLYLKKELALIGIAKLKYFISERNKREKLLEWRIRNSTKLRKEGLTYRAIGAKLDMDWSHARRLCKRYLKDEVEYVKKL